MRTRRLWLQSSLLLTVLWLVGCANQPIAPNTTPHAAPHAATQQSAQWLGRLSLKVYSKPVQAFSANFDLQGTPTKGTLALTSPLGTTLAHMKWDQGSATLLADGKQQDFDSLQAMAFKLTGTNLPVASLFAWLGGQAEEAPGWQVDLKELPDGRLQARHLEEVQAELKIILER